MGRKATRRQLSIGNKTTSLRKASPTQRRKRKRSGREALAVQWLGPSAFTATALVQSLVGELISHKSCGTAKKISQLKKLFLKDEGIGLQDPSGILNQQTASCPPCWTRFSVAAHQRAPRASSAFGCSRLSLLFQPRCLSFVHSSLSTLWGFSF